jgi:hypothetical protein
MDRIARYAGSVLRAKSGLTALGVRHTIMGACGRNVPVAQLDRASASGAEGCRFESCRGY